MDGRKYADGAAKIVWIDLRARGGRRRCPTASRAVAARRGEPHDDRLTEPAVEPSPRARRAGEPHRVRGARRARGTASTLPDYDGALALVDRRKREAFWREVWDYAGVIGERGDAHARRRRPDAGRALVSGCAAQLRARTCSSASAPTTPATRSCSGARTRSSGACRTPSCTRACRASAQALARCGRRRRRSRRGVPAEHAGDDRRDARRQRRIGAIWSSCSPDFGVQGVLDRFGQIEPKVLVRRRRLLVQRQAAADPRQGRARSSRGCRRVRARGRRAVSAGSAGRVRRSRAASATPSRGTTSSRRIAAGADRLRARCRSIIRSTSSIRRARPACRSASCTAPAARCCST